LFSWWTAPGEAEAFQNLVDAHKVRYPESRLFNAAVASGIRAKEILKQRLVQNDLPDLFQENAYDLKIYIQNNRGKIAPLDDLYETLALRDSIFPEVLSDLAIDGHFYAMPVNLHRENTLLYSKKLFAQHGLSVPRNLAELKSVCEAFKRRKVTPIATSHQGWILRIMFNSIVAGMMGPKDYQLYFTGKLPREDIRLRQSIHLLGELLSKYTNSDAGDPGFGWTNAAQAVMNGDAAMYLHGDWAKGYVAQLGAVADVDVGVVAAPGTTGLFLYNSDVFAMPLGAPNAAGARAFLETISTPAAQAAFNRVKGSSPVRPDVELPQSDPVSQATLRDLREAEVRMVLHTGDGWDDAIGRFAKDHDEEALYRVYLTNPPLQ
jgi:glucose/mannose transport system substrate-binding protein